MSSQCGTCSQWGGALEERKLIWDRVRWWKERGEGQRRSRGECREPVQPGPGRVPGFPLSSPVCTQRNFVQFHSSPFSGHWKGTDSFLVTHPLSCESGCYHGKIQTFGIHSGLPLFACAAASEQTAAPRNVCEICVCVRFGGALLGLNQTGPLIQGVQSAVLRLFAFMWPFQRAPVGASLCVCPSPEKACGGVSDVSADPVRWPQRRPLLNQTRAPGGFGGTLPSPSPQKQGWKGAKDTEVICWMELAEERHMEGWGLGHGSKSLDVPYISIGWKRSGCLYRKLPAIPVSCVAGASLQLVIGASFTSYPKGPVCEIFQ